MLRTTHHTTHFTQIINILTDYTNVCVTGGGLRLRTTAVVDIAHVHALAPTPPVSLSHTHALGCYSVYFCLVFTFL